MFPFLSYINFHIPIVNPRACVACMGGSYYCNQCVRVYLFSLFPANYAIYNSHKSMNHRYYTSIYCYIFSRVRHFSGRRPIRWPNRVCQNAAKKDRKFYKRQWIKDDSRKYKKRAKVVYGRPSCAWETSTACQVFVQLAIYILVYIKQGS